MKENAICRLSEVTSVEVDHNTLQAGVATYTNDFFIKLELPCSKEVTKKFSLGPFSEKKRYPEFYSCLYAKLVPLPNEHIPYLRIRKLKL